MHRKRLIFITWLFLTIFPIFAFAQDILVKLDKNSYRQGEKIEITLKNSSPEKIFSIAASATPAFSIPYIERKNQTNEWEKLSIRCEWPECYNDFDGPAEIRPSQVVTFLWESQNYHDRKYFPLSEGVYRITVTWQIRRGTDSKNWIWGEVKTEEFTISQK